MTSRASMALAEAGLIALLAVALVGGTAVMAAPKNGGRSSVSATVVPSCNPCAAGTVVQFTGSGYDASQGKAVLDISGAITSTAVYADGTINFDWPYFGQPGSYVVKVFQDGRGHKLVLKAETTVAVE
ncbi:MAG TPA: hypothetical protein VFK38_05425 [Candidatus Limnocylindrales bacterium]|nr:hypothetical protein [Candidatus Limnocylindrales bacterium]